MVSEQRLRHISQAHIQVCRPGGKLRNRSKQVHNLEYALKMKLQQPGPMRMGKVSGDCRVGGEAINDRRIGVRLLWSCGRSDEAVGMK